MIGVKEYLFYFEGNIKKILEIKQKEKFDSTHAKSGIIYFESVSSNKSFGFEIVCETFVISVMNEIIDVQNTLNDIIDFVANNAKEFNISRVIVRNVETEEVAKALKYRVDSVFYYGRDAVYSQNKMKILCDYVIDI